MSEPRNVSPDAPAEPGGRTFRDRYRNDAGRGDAPEWAAWGWASGGRRFPWSGILLVLLGAALLLREVVPGLSFSTIILLGLGLAFGGAWLLGRSRFAATPAFILLGLGIAPLLRDLGYISGDGWTGLILGVALLALWGVGELTHERHGWALWAGGILGLIGLAQVSDRIPGFPDVGNLWPLLLILVGLVIMFGGRFSQGRRAP